MSLTEKMWDALTTVIRMNVERLANAVKAQQQKIEDLSARVIRLETALDAPVRAGARKSARRQIES